MQRLKTMLNSIDHKGYPAYKGLKGSYDFGDYRLGIDKVQGDPFASSSRISLVMPQSTHAIPKEFYEQKHRRIAVEDHLLRLVCRESEPFNFKAKGSGKSGLIAVSRPGQEIVERSACHINAKNGELTVRMSVGFPANGRSINARELGKIFFQFIPEIVHHACCYANIDAQKLQRAADLADDQRYIREQMAEEGYIAFIANGSVLPRENGVSQRPMKKAVPFATPESMEVTWNLPHKGMIQGMGIKKGVTLIVGGGYHGKSTLLQTLERAVYPHIAGDGREYVAMEQSAVKIRSEDGRSIYHKDISPFIRNLPTGRDTTDFSSEDASGSTSQAANVVEAVENGAGVLLIDEDTSATNFMIRDELMEKVVAAGEEPIIPFIKRVKGLYEQKQVSTILVAGSCGAFFHIADTILQMESYRPKEITQFAKETAKAYPLNDTSMAAEYPDSVEQKIFIPKQSLEAGGREHRRAVGKYSGDVASARSAGKSDRGTKIKVMGTDGFAINKTNVDLRYLEQIIDSEQMAAIARSLVVILEQYAGQKIQVSQAVSELVDALERDGLNVLSNGNGSDLAMPRRAEIAGCLNRYRGIMKR